MLQRALECASSRSAGLREHILGNYGTGPQVIVANVSVVPVHQEPAVTPARARNATDRTARAGAIGAIAGIQVLSGFFEELEHVEQLFL